MLRNCIVHICLANFRRLFLVNSAQKLGGGYDMGYRDRMHNGGALIYTQRQADSSTEQ